MEDRNEAIQLVQQGERLVRIENETMMTAATQRPRDEEAVYQGALRELQIAPELAEEAYYTIPYRERRGDDTKVVNVTGPSVKAAMALARRWGNCAVGARIVSEDEDGLNIEGVFLDFETNFRVCRPYRVLKLYRRRDGRIERLSADRLNLAIQAGVSKAVRNAILAGLPSWLVTTYDRKAREIVAGMSAKGTGKSKVVDNATKAKVIDWFASRRVRLYQLEDKLGRPASEWTPDDIAELRGIANAIKDGEITIGEAFARAPIPMPEAEDIPQEIEGEVDNEPDDADFNGEGENIQRSRRRAK